MSGAQPDIADRAVHRLPQLSGCQAILQPYQESAPCTDPRALPGQHRAPANAMQAGWFVGSRHCSSAYADPPPARGRQVFWQLAQLYYGGHTRLVEISLQERSGLSTPAMGVCWAAFVQ